MGNLFSTQNEESKEHNIKEKIKELTLHFSDTDVSFFFTVNNDDTNFSDLLTSVQVGGDNHQTNYSTASSLSSDIEYSMLSTWVTDNDMSIMP